MIELPPPAWSRFLVLAALGGVAGCGGGGGGSSGLSAGMSITSCSLSCSDSAGNPGAQVSCGVTNVKVNQELRVTFTSEIDQITVTNNTFQMIEIGTGKTPAGAFSLDAHDARTLIYRPQLTFDSSGNPIFGLTEGRSYFLKIPGQVLDPLGPYIRNKIGTPNSSRLQCTLVASGIADPKPGRPRVTVTVDRVTGYDGNGEPNAFEFNVTAQGATSVFRASPVRMVFDDVMNPATLANPVTNSSGTISAFVDADGDVSTTDDRVPITGTFSVTIDQSALRTTVVFTPTGGFPSAGSQTPLRKIGINLSPQIADIGPPPNNTLLNAGLFSFTSEQIALDPIESVERFADDSGQDQLHTGSVWGNGITAPGVGGGSGRLGDLIVPPGVTVELDTDSEDFAGLGIDAFNPVNVIDRPVNLVVTGGVFEFSRLRVDTGGVLRFKGSHPARLYVRGEASISGVVDLSGASGRLQKSDTSAGGVGGTSGPNGGAGGRGGNRPDGANFVTVGGVPTGAGPSNVLDPATYVLVNGENGTGVQFPSTVAPGPVLRGGGGGGLAWPQPSAANLTIHMPQTITDVGGMQTEKNQLCQYVVPAASGGGGSHAIPGRPGEAIVGGLPSTPTTPAPPAAGGSNLLITSTQRTLSPELGYLRGGGGGGGGGGHLELTQVNGIPLTTCSLPLSGVLSITNYVSHSSAGGGGGGGGFQLAAGRQLLLSGVIDASGGDGGSGTFPPNSDTPSDLAEGGGGGAGGSVLLQSQRLQIAGVPSRVNVSGGVGGEGAGQAFFPVHPAHGGTGSPGLLRMESITPLDLVAERAKVAPTSADLATLYGGAVAIEDIFTGAPWDPPTDVPSGWSGAQSCWFLTTGDSFRLLFADDSNGLGWDMRLRIVGQSDPQSFRGANDLFPVPLEQVFGSDFGTAPVIVRFQGARASGVLTEPCAVPETGASSPITAGSITDWVRHPSELTDFYNDPARSPNMFRFVVLWDRSQADLAQIEGVEDVTVQIQPD